MSFEIKIDQAIRKHLGFPPTEDQRLLIDELELFLNDQEHRNLFILKGYAGTGKTTMIGALIKTLNDLKRKTVLLAPTGRAAKVLSNYAKKDAATIHRRIYFQQTKAGYTQFVPQKNLYKDALFIVDEASMIGDSGGQGGSFLSKTRSLLDDLLQYVFSGERCKVIFVGDVAQLPPVGLSMSTALDPQKMERSFYCKVYQSELKQVIRQKEDSGILHNATLVREFAIGNQQGTPKMTVETAPDFKYISGEYLEESIEDCYNEFGKENTLIITRSNKHANLFNQQIRYRVLWMEEKLSSGDLMMVVKNNYFWLGDKENAFIANGDIIKVERINYIEDRFGFQFADCEVSFLDIEGIGERNVKLLLNAIDAEGPSISRADNKRLYEEVANSYHYERSQTKKRELIKVDPYFNALQVKFAYAVTCHKSQGGQWDAVFVEQGFLTEEMIDQEWCRWLYTAITRAKKKLFLINFHPRFIQEELNG